jgi:peptidoglycan-associated lipoprotein
MLGFKSIRLPVLAAGALLLAACAKHHGMAEGQDLAGGLSAQGLGGMEHFAGQEAGEMYTTQAPHNQIYLFSYDDSNLNDKYMPSLEAQGNYLKNHQNAKVLIAGHTDERGSREYNIALGERRANTVSDALRMMGVSSHQVRVISYGKERPANLGHDEASHAQNRRVEFTYEATQ